jgi:hypothetical protein
MSNGRRWTSAGAIRVAATAVGLAADAAIGIGLARAGTRVSSAAVGAASLGSAFVVISEVGKRQTFDAGVPRRRAATLRSSASTLGWSGLAWSCAALAEDRNVAKAPLGPALIALQGITLVSGSALPTRVATGTAQIATGVIMSGAAARHEDPVASAVAITAAGALSLARVAGLFKNDGARTTAAILDAGARVGLAVAANRLAHMGDERLF